MPPSLILPARGAGVAFTEDPAACTPANLADVQAVVWNNATGGTLSAEGKAAFRAFIDLPDPWVRRDEWYSFDRSVRGRFGVLATLDEGSYAPYEGRSADARWLKMGDDHPIVWHRCVGEGRAFYSAIGHHAEAYAEPAHRAMIAGAIVWTLGEGTCPR